ncbi:MULTISPECIES: hypothetical protein [unclassified Roseateles]|uniref:hypothetical protein n=1 Tax=unclassified Roseateles TaxID=2626991 RepID=UPI0006FE6692|nr:MULTISPECIES: hypothetical protein [unclassified Roseateles]KQW42911.1 hypothetical protein ASC81_19875 [Pelomonas sp. Root405]KRA69589.1 hypothetical protein ASD88_20525 [Pelomonas sp. Root662]
MRVLATAIAALVSTLPALATNTPADHAQAFLRDGCSQSYASHSAHHPPGAPGPAFTGERYKGDNRYYNDAKPCDEAQYALYLEKADPATVAFAHPPSAGKAKPKRPPTSAAAPAKPK